MRGTWDDVNRRLTGAILALDLHDVLTVGEQVEQPRRGLLGLGRRHDPRPRRWASVTAAQHVLIAEGVGATSFGGEWETDEAQVQRLERMGWQRPWSASMTTWQREAPLVRAPNIALAVVRALETLGCEVADLEVSLTREEPDD